MTVPIYIVSNQNSYWLLPGCCHQLNKYWPNQDVTIVGYGGLGETRKKIPSFIKYHRIAKDNYPASKWTNGLIEFLDSIQHENIVIMLEDYWIIEPVKSELVNDLYLWMNEYGSKQYVLKVDLTGDRASKRGAVPYIADGIKPEFNMIQTPRGTPYLMSTQAAIWNRKLLLSVLVENETPWQCEIRGSARLNKNNDVVILGTRNYPVKYNQTYRRRSGISYKKISKLDMEKLTKKGFIR